MFLTWLILFAAKWGSEIVDGLDCPGGEPILVNCESWGFKYQVCPVGDGTTVIDSVEVVDKQSVSQCNFFDGNYLNYNGPNGDYGYTKNILWVDNGCRASFNVCSVPGCPGTLTRVNCSSWKYNYERCKVPEAGTIIYATVYNKHSVSSCNPKGNSASPDDYPQTPWAAGIFGYQYDTLWVNSGCRGEFEVCYSVCIGRRNELLGVGPIRYPSLRETSQIIEKAAVYCAGDTISILICSLERDDPCIIKGDPHMQTSDTKHYIYGGQCTYYVVYDIITNFRIKGELFQCRPHHPSVSCLKVLIIEYIGIVIRLERKNTVFVDDIMIVTFPYDNGTVKIWSSNSGFMVKLDNGVSIFWDGKKYARINLPISFLGITRGLCGTYDFNSLNDFMLPDGTVIGNKDIFVDSWVVDGTCPSL